jgi:uncharacterized membrane protein
MYGDHMTSWGWTMMVVWAIVGVGLIGFAVWVAATWARNGSRGAAPTPPPSKGARELLDERLARGNVDPDDHDRRRATLERRTPADA